MSMATTTSQPPANLAKTPMTGPSRASTSVPPPSVSPSIPTPSSTPAGPGLNGGSSSFLLPAGGANDVPMNADLRLYPRDGRVRNPVPSKLKDVTEQMKGNFSVMHMDVASHRASEGRDAAAKRTSESTALQARMAQTDAYVSHQRRANYPRPPGLKQFTPTKISESPVDQASPSRLTVTETKAEQARLLTLLRTLSPPTVVDQLCKALAFFGGIPEAPPPADGKFPESAESNGQGSLFVGWIAEIFPNLENPRKATAPPPSTQAANDKRPRGRPKGSKASKARSDKGLKKGSQKSTKGSAQQVQDPQDPQDDSWVDVDDSVLELNHHGDLVSTQPPLATAAPITPSRALNGGMEKPTPASSVAPEFRPINNNVNAAAAPGSVAKRRGRPKGSKNRPKEASTQAGQPAAASTTATQPFQVSPIPPPPPPKVTPIPVPVPMLDLHLPKKTNTGRQKGSKNRPKTANVAAAPGASKSQQVATDASSSQHQAQGPNQNPMNAPSLLDRFPSSTPNGTSQVDTPTQSPAIAIVPNTQAPTPHVKPSSVVGKKRKRQNATTAVPAPVVDGNIAATPMITDSTSQQSQASNSQSTSTSQLQTHAVQPVQQPTPTQINHPAPPTKRPRKSQEVNSMQTARRQTPNNTGTKNPPASSAPPAPEPMRPSSQMTISSQNTAPAEGLEAHYERIAGVQPRNDQTQSYVSRQAKQLHQSSTPPIPTSLPAEGLEAHYERFAAPYAQNLDNTRQSIINRNPKPQQTTQAVQTASPLPPHTSQNQAPQMSTALPSQQQARPQQNYYSQPQTLTSSYNTQQPSYTTNPRQQHMATGSPSNTLIHHVTNSPQFGTQSNSPLLQTENNYRGSPSIVHSSTAAFAPRRTPSASPLDSTNTYRPTNPSAHGLPSHSPHFGPGPGPRQPPTTSTAQHSSHTSSHPAMTSTFPSFSDPGGFLDMHTLDSGGSHGSLSLGAGAASSYALGGNSMPQRSSSSATAAAAGAGPNVPPLYAPATGMSTYLGQTTSRASQQGRAWGS
ncbi:hypothetical protein F4778DRAFT_756108 [Xylariomycetidae sp. FL2044]|nr:hypothetical protein F4778DRAFT_756108 [Xylariomycetidae sp. FL2044]